MSRDVRSDFKIQCRTVEPTPYVSVLQRCVVLTEINISVSHTRTRNLTKQTHLNELIQNDVCTAS